MPKNYIVLLKGIGADDFYKSPKVFMCAMPDNASTGDTYNFFEQCARYGFLNDQVSIYELAADPVQFDTPFKGLLLNLVFSRHGLGAVKDHFDAYCRLVQDLPDKEPGVNLADAINRLTVLQQQLTTKEVAK